MSESGFVRTSTASQPGRSRNERSAARATGSEPEWSSIAISFRFVAGLEQLGVDSGRHDAVVAGEALGGGRGRLPGRREEGVDASEQLLSERASRRIAEPLGREERRDAERLRVAQGEVRDARQSGLEAVDDVEAPLLERQVQVRAHADRDAEARPARHRHGRADRDHVGVLAARERTPAGDQVRRAGGGGQHGDRVAERSQLLGDPGDVLVDIVRL